MATIIGIMHSGSPGRHDNHINNAFVEGIKSLGLSDTGANADFHIALPVKWARDNPDNLPIIAGELDTDGTINVIVAAGGTASALAARNQTGPNGSNSRKKVVFTSVSAWPVDVDNMTGVIARTTDLDPDRLEKLSKLLPGDPTVGVLLNLRRPDRDTQKTALARKAKELGFHTPLNFQDIDPNGNVETQINGKFSDWSDTADGVLVAADSLFNNHRPGANGIISAAADNDLPTIYQWSEFVDEGGLISYGPNLSLAYFLAGTYVGQIVRGETPDKLRPLLLNNLEMVINLPTAKALTRLSGIPVELLANADRIITRPNVHIP
jgi:putative ABC transport system substrate-binding protein